MSYICHYYTNWRQTLPSCGKGLECPLRVNDKGKDGCGYRVVRKEKNMVSEKKEQPACLTCRFFSPIANRSYGECRRYAPRDGSCGFQHIDNDKWCGEWEKK